MEKRNLIRGIEHWTSLVPTQEGRKRTGMITESSWARKKGHKPYEGSFVESHVHGVNDTRTNEIHFKLLVLVYSVLGSKSYMPKRE